MPAAPVPRDVDVATVRAWLDEASPSTFLIDVREREEWEEGHVAGAFHLPLTRFDPGLLPPPGCRPLVMMCRSGKRSLAAARLIGTGAAEVLNLKGGVLAWIAAGYPLVDGP